MVHLTITCMALVLAMGLYQTDSALPDNTYLIQTKVYVDATAQAIWKKKTGNSDMNKLKEHIKGVFINVQQVFETLLRHGKKLIIKFELVEINILPASTTILPLQVASTYGIKLFKTYLRKYKIQYDFAYLYTGTDIAKGVLGTAGGYEVCMPKSLAIGEFTAHDKDVVVTAHEIAHTFGADHDGVEGKTDLCPNEGFIMSSFVYSSPNKYTFSKCTYTQHLAEITAKGSCLRDGDIKNAVSGEFLGATMTADEMCKRELSSEYYVNRRYLHKLNYGDNTCRILMCVNDEGDNKKVQAIQGLICGKNKQCMNTKCVEVLNKSPNTKDMCPFGDQPGLPGDKKYKTCADVPLSECHKYAMRCCQRCG